MILDTLRLESEVQKLRGEAPKNSKTDAKLGEAGGIGEIARLKKEIAQKDRDIETLKKQSQGLANEYNRLGDQQTVADGSVKKDR